MQQEINASKPYRACLTKTKIVGKMKLIWVQQLLDIVV